MTAETKVQLFVIAPEEVCLLLSPRRPRTRRCEPRELPRLAPVGRGILTNTARSAYRDVPLYCFGAAYAGSVTRRVALYCLVVPRHLDFCV